MDDEQIDQYLIHSDVFGSSDNQIDSQGCSKDSVSFFIYSSNENKDTKITTDEDGDLDVCRPERIDLTLVHRNETNISHCGYQLWNGALLLCDYLLTNQRQFQDKFILELGAGIGLCSIIASRFASTVICTDHDNDLLEIVKQNIEANRGVCRKESIRIQKFDWQQFDLNEIDDRIEILLAADVIYDDDLTDILFNVFTKLFQDKIKLHSIYITIEKRINFYLETLSVQCPAYEYFLEKLNQLKSIFPILNMELIDTDENSLRQCTSIYQRTRELVLWRIYKSDK